MWDRIKFWFLVRMAKQTGANICDIDKKSFSMLVELKDEISALITLDAPNDSINIETTIVFDNHISNLKTISSIAHIAYYYKMGISGLTYKNKSHTRFYLGKDISFNSALKSLTNEFDSFFKCVSGVTNYLMYRISQEDLGFVDISMFETIDLGMFDPKGLGEKKDFVFDGSWDNFIESVLTDDTELFYDLESFLDELRACQEFEQRNNLLLSEVGGALVGQIIWHRQMQENAKEDKYSEN